MEQKDKQTNQQQQDLVEFRRIITTYPQEVKYMIAKILDAEYPKAVVVWNSLDLKPTLKEIKFKNNTLILISEEQEKSLINFDNLLGRIAEVLEA